jgi:hypothetical protein
LSFTCHSLVYNLYFTNNISFLVAAGHEVGFLLLLLQDSYQPI